MAKKRSPRLAYAVWAGSTTKFSDEDWARFEAALGAFLIEGVRAAILEAARAYLRDVGKEAAAPLAQDEAAWLERLRSVAGKLQALIDEAKIGSAKRSGLAEVQAALNGMMVEPSAFDLMMAPVWLDAAVGKVLDRRKREAERGLTGFDDGGAWGILVRRLAAIFESWGIKVTVRTDDEANEKPSSFTKFICEIQKGFPREAQHPVQSMYALAAAIKRERKPAI